MQASQVAVGTGHTCRPLERVLAAPWRREACMRWRLRAEGAGTPGAPRENANQNERLVAAAIAPRRGGKGRVQRTTPENRRLRGERPTRQGREGSRPRKTLEEISLMDRTAMLEGSVRVVLEEGVILRVRAEVDGYLPMSEMGDWGPLEKFQRGMQVRAHVLSCNPARHELRLTLRRGGYVLQQRIKVEAMRAGEEYDAQVKKIVRVTDKDGWVQNGGVFVDFGCQVDGYLESAVGVPPVGRAVRVRALPVDMEEARVRRRIPMELAIAPTKESAPADRPAAAAAPAAAKGKQGKQGKQAAAPAQKPQVEEEDEDEDSKYAYLDELF